MASHPEQNLATRWKSWVLGRRGEDEDARGCNPSEYPQDATGAAITRDIVRGETRMSHSQNVTLLQNPMPLANSSFCSCRGWPPNMQILFLCSFLYCTHVSDSPQCLSTLGLEGSRLNFRSRPASNVSIVHGYWSQGGQTAPWRESKNPSISRTGTRRILFNSPQMTRNEPSTGLHESNGLVLLFCLV